MGSVLYRRYWTHGAQAPHGARLLSIALAGHYPSPSLVRNPCKRKQRDDQTRNRRDLNNRAVARYHPSPFSQVRKKEDEQQHRFLSLLRSSQHCLLPGRMFCFTFVKHKQTRKVCCNFLGLACVIWGHRVIHCAPDVVQFLHGLRSTEFRHHKLTQSALDGVQTSSISRHASLRSTEFRRHLSLGHPPTLFA